MTTMPLSSRFDPRSEVTLNERLVALLFRRNVTQARLALLLDLASPAITRRMRGEIDWRLAELQIVAEHLGTTVGYLLGETDDDRRPEHLFRNDETPAANDGGNGCALRDSNPRPSDP